MWSPDLAGELYAAFIPLTNSRFLFSHNQTFIPDQNDINIKSELVTYEKQIHSECLRHLFVSTIYEEVNVTGRPGLACVDSLDKRTQDAFARTPHQFSNVIALPEIFFMRL